MHTDQIDRLDWFLDIWVRWMRQKAAGVFELGYPTWSQPFISGGYSATLEELCAPFDVRDAEATNAAIESLEAPGPHAIHVIHLGAKWSWEGPEQVEAIYPWAREMVGIILRRRGIWH